MPVMEAAPEIHEGKETYRRFEDAMRAVLSVPHSVLAQRIAGYRKEADAGFGARPHKR